MQECHVRDATAVVSFLSHLEDELLVKNNKNISEYDAAQILQQKR